MSLNATAIPNHVPAELVFDFDFYSTPGQFSNPQQGVSELLHGGAPPIFYTPHNGGHWVVSRRKDCLEMLRDHERFPVDPQYNHDRRNNPVRFLVKDYDPPEHTEMRNLINPVFAVDAIRNREPLIREVATSLIDAIFDQGQCEFVSEVAEAYPVEIFLRMVRAPLHLRQDMLDLAHKFFRSQDPAAAREAMTDLGKILTGVIESARADPDENDMLSRLVEGEVSGRPLTDDEILGGAIFVFLAGLDTVTAMLSFVMKYLASNPDQYQRLIDEPEILHAATEELIRVSGVAQPERGVKGDFEHNGVQFKEGDRLIFLIQIGGMDPEAVENSQEVDFDRARKSHMAFSSGQHHCSGAGLTRSEIEIFLEEWTRRVKSMSLTPGSQIRAAGGRVWMLEKLPLIWATK
ncbi:cytochrome P450 [Actinomycetota bacterium]|nr:cytochrome P450 [Actinomycetota bacterium]